MLNQVLSLNTSLPVQLIDKWNLRLNGTVSWQQIRDNSMEVEQLNSNVNWNVNMVNTILLPKEFTLEIFGSYVAPTLAGNVIWEATSLVDISLQKKFEKSSLALTLANVTKGGIWNGSLNSLDQGYDWTTFFEVYNERILRLTFSTSLGNSKIKESRTRETAGIEEKGRL